MTENTQNQKETSTSTTPLVDNADFTALPVGGGDAFLFHSEGDAILVDGGYPNDSFPETVDDHLVGDQLDVVICTHNDNDHSGGILSLLQDRQQRITIGEIWLPLHWTENLINLTADPAGFLVRLIEDYKEAGLAERDSGFDSEAEDLDPDFWGRWSDVSYERQIGRETKPWDEEETGDLLGEIIRRETDLGDLDESAVSFGEALPELVRGIEDPLRDFRLSFEGISIDALSRRIDQALSLEEADMQGRDVLIGGLRYLGAMSQTDIDDRLYQLQVQHPYLTSLINLAKNIRLIYHHAQRWGIPIRWFENTVEQPRLTPRHDLQPLNSSWIVNPVHHLSQRPIDYVARAASNEHSLVFWAKLSCAGCQFEQGGILLSADSTFTFAHKVDLPSPSHMLVTAPHHGSDSNAKAYVPILQSSYCSCETRKVYVRSGEQKSSWPGDAYLQLSGLKACTQCRNGSAPKAEATRFKWQDSMGWRLRDSNRRCSCDPNAGW